MPARNHKGRFTKGHKRSGSRGRTTAIVIASPRAPSRRRSSPRHVARKTRRRGKHSGGGVRLLPLAITAAAVGWATGKSGPAFVKTTLDKIPGSKTFGAPATLGLACLAVDRYVKPNKWLKLAGVAGVAIAALQMGQQGTDFKWVGDNDDVGDADDDMISDVDED